MSIGVGIILIFTGILLFPIGLAIGDNLSSTFGGLLALLGLIAFIAGMIMLVI